MIGQSLIHHHLIRSDQESMGGARTFTQQEVTVPAVLTELHQHVVQDVSGLILVVSVKRLEPS